MTALVETVDIGRLSHGTQKAYRKGCRCDLCTDTYVRTRAEERKRRTGNLVERPVPHLVVPFRCPNCGAMCTHVNSSKPAPLGSRTTAVMRCFAARCNRSWQIIATVVPLQGDH